MNKVLYIKSSPRGAASRTIGIADALIGRIRKTYSEVVIDELDLFAEKLPDLFADTVKGKYVLMGGNDLPAELKPLWYSIESHVNRFMACDAIVLAAPMWNFGLPYVLKHYIDVIFQPRYLFRYTPAGPEGLAKNKKMFVVTTRGGDYGPDSPMRAYDLQEPYIRAAFGFVGITDITFINAQPMDAPGQETMHQKFEEALRIVDALKL